MTISFDVAPRTPKGADALGVPVHTQGPVPRTLGLNRAALASLGFEGKVGETHALVGAEGTLLVAVGMGEPGKVTTATLRRSAAALARAARKRTWLATALVDASGVEAKAAAQAVAEGLVLGSYRYVELKKEKGDAGLNRVTLLAAAPRAKAAQLGAERGSAIGDAVCLARDLVNSPPAYMTAVDVAEVAVRVGAQAGLSVEVLDEAAIADLALGGVLGVNQGSTQPPRVIKLTWSPRHPIGTVALVGKGVTYDSGGISLKPSDGMHVMMKMDMTGAADVLAALSVLPLIKPKVKVIGYLMCTDNMPSGSAMKLGDVLTIRNGTTVEIHNTDAEGRLLLADGLALAVEDGVDAIVDIATLTGACLVALGQKVAGLMGNDDGWVGQVQAAADRADEAVWRLPLPADYRKLLDSNVADLKNIGGPYGGALTAGLFLKEFVGDVPWAHLDIAGPMNSEADDGWLSKGGTAFGVRTFIELLEAFTPPAAS
jgi:leucyl aminopeptidase